MGKKVNCQHSKNMRRIASDCDHPAVAQAKTIYHCENCQLRVPIDAGKPALIQVGSRGLGDTVAKLTSALGIKPCGGCEGRRDLLNKLIPYGQKAAPSAPSHPAGGDG